MTSNVLPNGQGVSIQVERTTLGNLIVSGKIHTFAGFPQRINWIAPRGAHRGMSFSGSGLPYHNAEQAFEGTPNKGMINSPDGSFKFEMTSFPSAYYTGLGSVYVPPVVMLETVKISEKIPGENDTFNTHAFLTGEGIPYRWISGSPTGSRVAPVEGEVGRAMYYSGREDLPFFQNQEMLCRNKAYPSEQTNFSMPTCVNSHPWDNTPAPA
jgi:hypothetical protein